MRSRWQAIRAGHCPRCREGRVFAGTFRMHPTCPACSVAFEREPGYFLGAMYLSYGMGVAAVAVPVTVMILRGVHPWWIAGVAGAILAVLAPFLFRTSRVLWLHFDDHFDPLDDSGSSSVDPTVPVSTFWATIHVVLTESIPVDGGPARATGYYQSLGVTSEPTHTRDLIERHITDGAVDWGDSEIADVEAANLDPEIQVRCEPITGVGIWYESGRRFHDAD